MKELAKIIISFIVIISILIFLWYQDDSANLDSKFSNYDEYQNMIDILDLDPKPFDYNEYQKILDSKNPVRLKRYIESIDSISGFVEDYMSCENYYGIIIEKEDIVIFIYLSEEDTYQVDIGDYINVKGEYCRTDLGNIFVGTTHKPAEIINIIKYTEFEEK